MFIGMLYQIWNLRYVRHLRIINYIGLEQFILVINLDVKSSSNTFNTLVYMFRCIILLLELNEISLKKKALMSSSVAPCLGGERQR